MSQDHIFISYARKDGSEHAARFDTTLHQRGFKTWRDKRGIDPTQDFTAEIENALVSNRRRMLLSLNIVTFVCINTRIFTNAYL